MSRFIVLLYQSRIKLQYSHGSLWKYKMVSFAPWIMKYIAALFGQSWVPVKIICCIAFGSESSACSLLKSIAINL